MQDFTYDTVWSDRNFAEDEGEKMTKDQMKISITYCGA